MEDYGYETDKISAGDVVRGEYIRSANVLNSTRHFPSMFDGLKPVNRYIMYSCFDFTLPEMIGGTKAGHTIDEVYGKATKFHPHGTTGWDDFISTLINSGFLHCSGCIGEKTIYGSNLPQETRSNVRIKVDKVISDEYKFLMAFVDRDRIRKGLSCPSYLPTPVPFALMFGGKGIGIGLSFYLPAFEPSSIFHAFVDDDPSRLRIAGGLGIRKPDKGIYEMWEKGFGTIFEEIPVEKVMIGGKVGYLASVYSATIELNMKPIKNYIDRGLVSVADVSDSKQRVFFYLNKDNQDGGIKLEELEALVKDCSYKKCGFYTNVYNPIRNKIGGIGMRDWISITYSKYKEAIDASLSTITETITSEEDNEFAKKLGYTDIRGLAKAAFSKEHIRIDKESGGPDYESMAFYLLGGLNHSLAGNRGETSYE